jgi:hypothetical protein
VSTSDRNDETLRYVATATRRTVFLRTFLPGSCGGSRRNTMLELLDPAPEHHALLVRP